LEIAIGGGKLTAKQLLAFMRESRQYQIYDTCNAWYSGDTKRLKSPFWRRSRDRDAMHVPLAGELAAASANLLFSETPNIFTAAYDKNDPSYDKNDPSQERLQAILDANSFGSILLPAAEICAAYGDVYVKINWDAELSPFPILSVAPPTSAFVKYKFGIPAEYYFLSYASISETAGKWTFERYASGEIVTETYEGVADGIGQKTDEQIAGTDVNKPLAVHIPNILPNSATGSQDFGKSDIYGVIPLLDALDEAYSSWLRDVRLGKARLIVPKEYLRIKRNPLEDNQNIWHFDKEDDLYVAMDVDTANTASPITLSQFNIRSNEHSALIDELLNRIISASGYSPQSFGLEISGQSESGTALSLRLDQTQKTKAKKAAYWKSRLEYILSALLETDNAVFGQKHAGTAHSVFSALLPAEKAASSVSVEIKGDKNYFIGIADTLNQLNGAGAVSTYTKVQILHPDWDDEQINEEVGRIQAEQGLTVDNPEDLPYEAAD
jgi:hypothetical protein